MSLAALFSSETGRRSTLPEVYRLCEFMNSQPSIASTVLLPRLETLYNSTHTACEIMALYLGDHTLHVKLLDCQLH